MGNVVITVFLVTENGEPHLHSITGPGSTKTICKDVTLKDGTSGIQTWIGPEQNMTAVYVYCNYLLLSLLKLLPNFCAKSVFVKVVSGKS